MALRLLLGRGRLVTFRHALVADCCFTSLSLQSACYSTKPPVPSPYQDDVHFALVGSSSIINAYYSILIGHFSRGLPAPIVLNRLGSSRCIKETGMFDERATLSSKLTYYGDTLRCGVAFSWRWSYFDCNILCSF